MPTEQEYEYIERRLGANINREKFMSAEGCKVHDIPSYWLSKENGGSHWHIALYEKEYYLVRPTNTVYAKPIKILKSGRNNG